MEPISSSTAAESAPPSAPDSQLQHATETLLGQMGGAVPAQDGAEAPQPAQPGALRSDPEQPQATARPSRADLQQRAGQSWHQRMRAQARENRELQEMRAEYEARMAETNRLAAQALEALRAGRQPAAPEEELPDPYDPVALAKWIKDQNAAAVQAALKPITEAEQARQEHAQRQWEESQRSQEQNEAVAVRRDELGDYFAAYGQDSPQLAEGFDDRYAFMHDRIASAWKGLCHPGDESTLANMQFTAVVRYAEELGANPVMFLDAWFANLAGQFGWDPAGWEEDGAPAPTNGNGHHPPAESETERLARVRQRAAGAASAAPRQPGRATTSRSELESLLRAGVTDLKQLQQAALKDAGGRADQAAVLLAQAAGQMG